MANPSPRYTPEFKANAVRPYREAGPDATCAEIARGLGCDAGTLAKWVELANNDQPDNPGTSPFRMQEEDRGLRRGLARLKEEDGILLKAGAFLAGRRLRRRPSSHS